jgi:hypothetical protein
MRRLFFILTFCIAEYLPPIKVKWMYPKDLKEIIKFVKDDALEEAEPSDGTVVICCYPGKKEWWECGFFAVKKPNGLWYFANDKGAEVAKLESVSSYKEHIKQRLCKFELKIGQDTITNQRVIYSIIERLYLTSQPLQVSVYLSTQGNKVSYKFGDPIGITTILEPSKNKNLLVEKIFDDVERKRSASYTLKFKLSDGLITYSSRKNW